MILASQDFGTQLFMWVIIVIAFYSWQARKFLASNPEVKDAAKKAASDKAISLISKWLK